VGWSIPKVSGLTALLDADLLGWLGALDLATCCEALIAENAQSFDFGTLASQFAVFEHFEIAWAGHAIFIHNLFPLGNRPPKHEKFPDVLNRGRIEFVSQGLEHGFPRRPVIRKDADLDQSVGVQSCVGFFLYSGGKSITTHHDHRVKVVRVGAEFFALGRGQLNLGHTCIIGHEGKNESQN
jgi:hypothetical protein